MKPSNRISLFTSANSKPAQLFVHAQRIRTHTCIPRPICYKICGKCSRKTVTTTKTTSTSGKTQAHTSTHKPICHVVTFWVTFENYLHAQAVEIWLFTCNECKQCIASFLSPTPHRHRHCRHRRHHQYHHHHHRWLIFLNFFPVLHCWIYCKCLRYEAIDKSVMPSMEKWCKQINWIAVKWRGRYMHI